MNEHMLRLSIKKTNHHLYIYVLYNDIQVIHVSTDNRQYKSFFSSLDNKYHPEALGYLLARKMTSHGLSSISFIQRYPFQGKIAMIINTVKKHGICIK